jgi:hypothetical protein
VPPKPVAAVALLLLLAAGCGGTTTHDIPVDSPSSPLGTGGVKSEQCGPDASGAILTYGTIVLENHSKHPVTIQQVSFYGDHQLKLVHADVVPIRGGLIGIAYGWPPSQKTLAETGVPWSQRIPAAGAAVPPGTSVSSRRELLIGMLPTAHRGAADGVQVRYREGGKQYELRTHTKTVIIISKSASDC